MKNDKVNVAIAQYEVQQLPSWQAYENKIVQLIEDAKKSDADVLVLGEYAGLELASFTPGTLQQQFEKVQSFVPDYLDLFTSLANKYQIVIQPGTIPILEKDGTYRNRAYLFSPNSKTSYQDKLFLTVSEKETGLFKPGNELRVFEMDFGLMGINICYDVEFPAIANQLVQAGVLLILVPSCTEKISGLTRVSIACRARAIENQCYVAQSCLIGKASWCDFIDMNTGQSALFSPPDIGFPEDGILSEAQINIPMTVQAELSFAKLTHVRLQGEVQNFSDMKQDMKPLFKNINSVKMNS